MKKYASSAILAFVFAKNFNIVSMGRDFSNSLGVHYKLVLFTGLTIAALITGDNSMFYTFCQSQQKR